MECGVGKQNEVEVQILNGIILKMNLSLHLEGQNFKIPSFLLLPILHQDIQYIRARNGTFLLQIASKIL
jgi:hypothetical protein